MTSHALTPSQGTRSETMSEIESDDPRLRATEEQMRRALGLRQGSSPSGQVSNNVPHPQRRQFVRDGDVPVEVLHGPDNSSRVNQLAATREALQAQTTAREEAEQMLAEARHTIHDLQTKLGHERLARDEAVQRVEFRETRGRTGTGGGPAGTGSRTFPAHDVGERARPGHRRPPGRRGPVAARDGRSEGSQAGEGRGAS